MESFYREMRKKHELLIDSNEKPLGGKWNYDQSNRKKLPKNHKPTAPKLFQRDVSDIMKMLEEQNVKTIGSIDSKNFLWPVTRNEGEEMLEFFVEECLPLFGDFQDAMSVGEWSLYHSRLSFLMNSKILSPKFSNKIPEPGFASAKAFIPSSYHLSKTCSGEPSRTGT